MAPIMPFIAGVTPFKDDSFVCGDAVTRPLDPPSAPVMLGKGQSEQNSQALLIPTTLDVKIWLCLWRPCMKVREAVTKTFQGGHTCMALAEASSSSPCRCVLRHMTTRELHMNNQTTCKDRESQLHCLIVWNQTQDSPERVELSRKTQESVRKKKVHSSADKITVFHI